MPSLFELLLPKDAERQGFRRDVAALQQFIQQQPFAARTQLPAGQAGPVIAPQFPKAQSQAGAELFGSFLLNRQQIQGRRTPLTIADLRAAEAARTGARPGTPEFERIAVGPSLKAGPLQFAKAGDKTGLPEGTVFQTGPQGKVTIISEPQTLTIDEQRKRDLIAGGLQPKEVSELEKKLTRTVIAKNRAEAESKLRAGKGILTPEQKISQTNVFRKEFDALSKDFRTIRDSFGRMKAAATDPSGAGDIAVIFNFMKILDPGSVVRESEFATAENAVGVPDAIRNLWNKALTGEKIAFNRDDFLNTAQRLIKSQEDIQSKLIKRYTSLSRRFGLDPQDIITEVAVQQSTGLTSAQQKRREELRRKAGL